MPAIDYSRFYRYEDLMGILRGFADENPDYVSLETIGKSHEGRAIPLVTLTHRATGPGTDKPAYWSTAIFIRSSCRHRALACTSSTG